MQFSLRSCILSLFSLIFIFLLNWVNYNSLEVLSYTLDNLQISGEDLVSKANGMVDDHVMDNVIDNEEEFDEELDVEKDIEVKKKYADCKVGVGHNRKESVGRQYTRSYCDVVKGIEKENPPLDEVIGAWQAREGLKKGLRRWLIGHVKSPDDKSG
ncbi:hypothetical protein L6452_18282 [Arctium lappa]|uniref:Uncharacterized protein n=1 Tax=Arctium lappa TaxID=4217 RepID=A0ACB9C5Q4_ARCLA|nr:hypothetical protein L6452_18282 [Arctium lappa]